MKRHPPMSRSGSPSRPPKRPFQYSPASLPAGAPEPPRLPRRSYTNCVRCANCGREGHSLAICRDVQTPVLAGCPCCNVRSHNLDECPRRHSLTDSDLIELLILNRPNTVMIQTAFDWLDLFKRYADDESIWVHCRGFPHTLGFAKQTIDNARHYLKRGNFIYGKDIKCDPFTKDAATIKRTLQRHPDIYRRQTSIAPLLPTNRVDSGTPKDPTKLAPNHAVDGLQSTPSTPHGATRTEPLPSRYAANSSPAEPQEARVSRPTEEEVGLRAKLEKVEAEMVKARDRCAELEGELAEEKSAHEVTRRRMEGLLDKLLH